MTGWLYLQGQFLLYKRPATGMRQTVFYGQDAYKVRVSAFAGLRRPGPTRATDIGSAAHVDVADARNILVYLVVPRMARTSAPVDEISFAYFGQDSDQAVQLLVCGVVRALNLSRRADAGWFMVVHNEN